MENSYQNETIATEYIKFSQSEDAKIQQQTILESLLPYVTKANDQPILDLACGTGWLAGKISQSNQKVEGCDYSPTLVSHARAEFPSVNFTVADVTKKLPYEDNNFGVVAFTMAAHDVEKLSDSFLEISRITKPGGTILVTIANPYYSFPVGLWKRGLIGFMLRRKPTLSLRPYNFFKTTVRKFTWNNQFTSYFHTLPEYMESAKLAGLGLQSLKELGSTADDKKFSARFRLYRFPTMLLMVFKKPTK